jgi:hypothetical protein
MRVRSLSPLLLLSLIPVAASADPPPPRGYYGGGGHPGHYAPPPARAPMPNATWYMGLGIVGTSILDQSGGPEVLDPGGGLSLWAGVHLSDALSLQIGWLGSFHNPADVDTWYGAETDFLVLEAVTADARLHLTRGGSVFDPYLMGGVGLYWLGSEHLGMDSVGTGFQAGGGFDVWVGPFVTLGVRARYHGIAMGPPDGEGDNDTFISAATVEGSIALHF